MRHIRFHTYGLSPINSATINELLENRDPAYLRHDERTAQLEESEILRCYGNTIELRTKSSHFNEPGHKSYGKYWKQLVMFEDFSTIARDRQIPIEEAIDYAINYGDVRVMCTCPAFLYWAYKYMATQLDYIVPPYKENRAPTRNNVGLRGTVCKHADDALRSIRKNKDLITQMFAIYYKRLKKVEPSISVDRLSNTEIIEEHAEDIDKTKVTSINPDKGFKPNPELQAKLEEASDIAERIQARSEDENFDEELPDESYSQYGEEGEYVD